MNASIYSFEIELHDSSVERVVQKGSSLIIELDAVLLTTHSTRGWLPDEDHRIPISIEIEDAVFTSPPRPCVIFDGSVESQSESYGNVHPIEIQIDGACKLLLATDIGDYEISGTRLKVIPRTEKIPEHLRS